MSIKQTLAAAIIAASAATSAFANDNTHKNDVMPQPPVAANLKSTFCILGGNGKVNDPDLCCPKTGMEQMRGCPATPEYLESLRRTQQANKPQTIWQYFWN